MKIEAKQILIILLGIVGATIITILSKNELTGFENLEFKDIFILLVLSVSAIIYVIYRRIGEIDGEIENVKKNYEKLNERLKINNQLTNLEARLIYLERNKNGKKR